MLLSHSHLRESKPTEEQKAASRFLYASDGGVLNSFRYAAESTVTSKITMEFGGIDVRDPFVS